MAKVFVSGCYDILHAGHLQFFEEARALGDHLTVSFANEDILWKHKGRRPSLPDDHKVELLRSLVMVDRVVAGNGERQGLDFEPVFRELKPDILAVTEDDQYGEIKERLCEELGCRYVRLPKTPPKFEPISTTAIVNRIGGVAEAPLRVDFGGGWLDVPKYARKGGFIVNCAISPKVSLHDWPYEQKAGLGGERSLGLVEWQRFGAVRARFGRRLAGSSSDPRNWDLCLEKWRKAEAGFETRWIVSGWMHGFALD
ncbi:adenylyltransferase/cytidyltransferase family protein [Akkermansiaceae bacterium]|nr:adenylyltransferase/cytidyltransferase family protein [Akkermansiaceae bacterium]MDB4520554.1 adenylyltransferase/cytidyltransferase family protein [Akkermansiaceae bacterium]